MTSLVLLARVAINVGSQKKGMLTSEQDYAYSWSSHVQPQRYLSV